MTRNPEKKKIKRPFLSADTLTLYDLWANTVILTPLDISKNFKVSEETGRRAVLRCMEYAEGQGHPVYVDGRRKIAPTDIFFEMYGWDHKKIAAKARQLIK